MNVIVQKYVEYIIYDENNEVGSGGATLNALLVLTEHLSAR